MLNVAFNTAIGVISIGLLLVFLGLLHKAPTINRWDSSTFQFLHNHLRSYSGFFRYIWPLGTVPVGITLILIIFIASWQAGLIVALVYLIAAIFERTIKLKLNRSRPFESLSNVEMSQPKNPSDPSHPSGDTMRVWFLALVFPLVFGLSWMVFAFTIIVAATLSIGRIALGVHYPLDVVGGAGLGLFTTGIAVIGYQLAVII